MFVKIIAFTCLVATVSAAQVPTRRHVLPSASQELPQSVGAPGSAADQAAKLAAQQAKLHYVEIGPSLKGDYKFGYDTGSGPAGQSFREETRLDDGSVKGAYGYIDANGKQRIVKYTAGKNGFVVEGDQEAPGQGGASAAAAAPAQSQPEVRRPQAVALPQPQQAQPTFDEQPAAGIQRAPAPTAEDRLRAEQLHAEQLRQHQLAQQAAIAQQQRLAQQLQLQQQQIAAQQAAASRAQPQQQPQQQQFGGLSQQQFASGQPQQQFGNIPQQAPQPPAHQVIDPQNGQFFSSSSDGNINQLLTNQLRQLQSGNQFAGQFQPPAFQQQPQQQPSFQQQQPQSFPQAGFDFSQQRAARQANNAPQVNPQSALIALHQQQQHDAQVLERLRAQQLRQAQAQPQQLTPQAQPQLAPQQFARQPPQQVAAAPAAAPQQFEVQRGNQQQSSVQPAQQPAEVFGPPVIDIRTLNYSIGQQTRVN